MQRPCNYRLRVFPSACYYLDSISISSEWESFRQYLSASPRQSIHTVTERQIVSWFDLDTSVARIRGIPVDKLFEVSYCLHRWLLVSVAWCGWLARQIYICIWIEDSDQLQKFISRLIFQCDLVKKIPASPMVSSLSLLNINSRSF